MTGANQIQGVIRHNIITLKAGQIHSDADFQRPISKRQVRLIADNFDIAYWDYPKVAEVDGQYIVWDGQHRVAAIRDKFGDEQQIEVFIDQCSYQEAARRFAKQNDGKVNITSIDKMRARIESGDTFAIALNDMLNEHGLKFGGGNIPGNVACVGDMAKFYDQLGDARFDTMLNILSEGFAGDKRALSSKVVKGVGYFVKTYGTDINEQELIRKLKETPRQKQDENKSQLDLLITKASARHIKNRFDTSFAHVLAELYNVRKTSNKRLLLSKI